MDMGSVTVENVMIAGKIGAAVLNFIVSVAPLVAQLWGAM